MSAWGGEDPPGMPEPGAPGAGPAGDRVEALDAGDRVQEGGDDRFYQGIIARVDWGHETGSVRSGSGREVLFEFPFVAVLGAPRRVESLRAGMRVGFDVGWTSRGLRVTTLKIYT